jgi:hypothetical protein
MHYFYSYYVANGGNFSMFNQCAEHGYFILIANKHDNFSNYRTISDVCFY